jgi:hypothetical protein
MTLEERRFAALVAALIAEGLLGDGRALSQIDYAPPATAVPFWAVGPEDADRIRAAAVINGWDWTAAGELATQRASAVAAFMTSNDPVIVATRALFRLAFTWINDERESRGAARILEPDILALAMSGTLNDGLGDAPQGGE